MVNFKNLISKISSNLKCPCSKATVPFLKEILSQSVKFVKGTFETTHKAGYKNIIIAGILAFASWTFISHLLGLFFTLVFVWCIAFFRNPERFTPEDCENSLISPADGKVCAITKEIITDEEGNETEFNRVSIFLSVFDVHVNRIPLDGVVKSVKYNPGKFISASLDKSSQDNENNLIKIEGDNGETVYVKQIAGMIAKRIVCDIESGDDVKSGSRYGIIKFGSRVDLLFSNSYKINVAIGQKMLGGETVIGSKVE